MEVLGILSYSILFLCTVLGIVTHRIRWFLCLIWGIPLFEIGRNYTEGMEVNGLVILICCYMIIVCIGSVYGIRLWNIKDWKKSKIIYPIMFIITLILLFYTYYESLKLGYIHSIFSLNNKYRFLKIICYFIILIIFSKLSADSLYILTERFFSKKEVLKLIQCRFMIGKSSNSINMFEGYYLSGVNNGKMYHFKMTKRTFFMLRRQDKFILNTKKGCFGGIYITENPCPVNIKYVRYKDRKAFVLGILLYILSVAIIYFFFYIS